MINKKQNSFQLKALVLFGGVLFLLSNQGLASEELYTICKLGKTVRSLRVDKSPEGCKAIYTKAGVDAEVGNGQWSQSCVDITRNIESNLKEAGWKCRDIENAQVSELNSAPAQKAAE